MFGVIGWFFILLMGMFCIMLKVMYICTIGITIMFFKIIISPIMFLTTGSIPFFYKRKLM